MSGTAQSLRRRPKLREDGEKRAPLTGTLRVLLVEDSENDAMLLLRELRRGGYEPLSQRVCTPEDMEKALREAGARDCPEGVEPERGPLQAPRGADSGRHLRAGTHRLRHPEGHNVHESPVRGYARLSSREGDTRRRALAQGAASR